MAGHAAPTPAAGGKSKFNALRLTMGAVVLFGVGLAIYSLLPDSSPSVSTYRPAAGRNAPTAVVRQAHNVSVKVPVCAGNNAWSDEVNAIPGTNTIIPDDDGRLKIWSFDGKAWALHIRGEPRYSFKFCTTEPKAFTVIIATGA